MLAVDRILKQALKEGCQEILLEQVGRKTKTIFVVSGTASKRAPIGLKLFKGARDYLRRVAKIKPPSLSAQRGTFSLKRRKGMFVANVSIEPKPRGELIRIQIARTHKGWNWRFWLTTRFCRRARKGRLGKGQ